MRKPPSINRITPGLGPGQMQTYQIDAPLSSHFRTASCEEVNCPNHERGWVTVIDESTPLGKRQAAYIRETCRPTSAVLAPGTQVRARFVEGRSPAGWTEFRFGAGQECFKPHQVRLSREEIYSVRGGDWRGNPRGTRPRVHDKAEHWVEDMDEHLDKFRTLKERG